VNIGLSYRKCVFSRDDVKNLERRFQEHVKETQKAA
jgi:hypothetical protein